MRPFTVGDFALRCGGEVHGLQLDTSCYGFALDSREVQAGDLFLAVKGANVDGHEFAETAMKQGAVAVVSERDLDLPHVRVANLIDALDKFGSSHRQEFHGPVVGITGSNGKTSTKEFLAAALEPLGSVVKSAGNRNTEFTSPLLWAGVTVETQAVIAEMAMRGFGQIDHLAKIHRPTIAIITLIGTAHIEMVGSREGILEAKSEILRHLDGPAIFWAEDDYIRDLESRAKGRIRTFGYSEAADCRVLGYRALSWGESEVTGSLHGQPFTIKIGTIGKHQSLNAAAALLAATEAGVKLGEAAETITHAKLPPMRMEIRDLGGRTIVLDNYNASPDSTVAAIRTVCEVPSSGKKYAVLGAMQELGALEESGHRSVGKELLNSCLDRVLLYGELTQMIEDEALGLGYPRERISIAPTLDEVSDFIQSAQQGDTILIKGSRALRLEDALTRVDA